MFVRRLAFSTRPKATLRLLPFNCKVSFLWADNTPRQNTTAHDKAAAIEYAKSNLATHDKDRLLHLGNAAGCGVRQNSNNGRNFRDAETTAILQIIIHALKI